MARGHRGFTAALLLARRRPDRDRAQGQALVVFALLLVVLLGASGIFVDGGLAWGNRRAAQSAADVAALAAVKAKAEGGSITSAANAMAAANGFATGTVTCGGTSASGVIVNNPPAGGWTPPENLDQDTSHYIEVIVNRRMDTTFSTVMGVDCWLVSARAVARYTEVLSTGGPYPAILGRNACNGAAVSVSGNGLIVVGDLVSNSGVYDGGNNTIIAPPSSIHYTPDPTGCGPYPPPTPEGGDIYTTTAKVDLTEYPVTYTFNTGAQTITNDSTGASTTCTSYTAGNLTISSPTPAPGVYCASGKITLDANQMIGNVTLVAGDKIEATGSAPYNLTAYWDNLLAFTTMSGTPEQPVIDFNNGMTFTGLIFAPNGTPRIRGNNLSSSYGAVWGQTVTIDGNGMTLDSSGLSGGAGTTTYQAGTLVE